MTPQIKLLSPSECHPPHKVTHPEKVDALVTSFSQVGWNPIAPHLIGYAEDNGHVQLLTGSHRYAAALIADIKLPTKVYTKRYVEACWGYLDVWQMLMRSESALIVTEHAT